MALALQHSAIARLEIQSGRRHEAIGFSGQAVPDRIEALLHDGSSRRWVSLTGLVGYAGMFALVVGGIAQALERSEDLLEALQRLH